MNVSRIAVDLEAEANVPAAQVQINHYRFSEPPESTMRFDGRFRVDLCLSSNHRSARGSFCDRWKSHHFEHMGDIYVMPPTMTMHVRSDETAPLSAISCYLDLGDALELFGSKSHGVTEQLLKSSLDIRSPTVRQLLLRLASELRHPGFASDVLIESLVTQLQIELFRYGTAIVDCPGQSGLAAWQLRLIDERVKEFRAPSLAELAALCKVSVRQLTRAFRACRGTSIGSYVADSQMEHARRLLASDRSVEDIAQTLGFSCSSNFCVAFRRVMGMPPGRFRQTLMRD